VKGGGVAERGKGKEIENPLRIQLVLNKRKKLQFNDEPKETHASRRLPISKI
jgi:hypothetical protein